MAQGLDRGLEDPARSFALAEREERLRALVLRRTKLTEGEAALLREVFPVIAEAHGPWAWRRIRRRRIPFADAMDLLQDIMLALLAGMLEEGFPESVEAKVRELTVGKMLNHLRSKRREPFSVGLPSSGSEPPKTPPNLDRTIDGAALRERLLPLLSDEHRAVIELCILDGLSHTEAGEVLQIPTGTVKTRLYEAKRRLVALAEQLPPGRSVA